MLACGDAILMPTPGVSSLHLWIIITDPLKDSGSAVILSVTTRRAHSDLTLILKPGDHPWIKHDSVIMYSDAAIIDTASLEKLIRDYPDDYVVQNKCSDALIAKIKTGLLKSRFTPNKIMRYCIKSWNS
jgi:hypothetical protein